MTRSLLLILTGSFLLNASGLATAATVTVDSGTDPIDINWQTATIADLPGPDGRISFSEAMIATNNTAGPDTIAFNIPQNDWPMQWLYPGRAVVQSSYTYFWRAFDTVVVDGTTQTAFTGDTNPDGAEVVLYGGEIYFNVDGCALYGLDGGAYNFSGSNSEAVGNTGGMNLTFYGGSGSLVQGNICGTIKIDRSSENVVVGNVMNRVRVLGGGPPAVGNRIGGPDPADRNYLTGYGYVNGEGLPAGSSLQIFDSIGTIVENNWIGTTTDGLAQGNLACTMGVSFEGENHDAVIRNNLISGILGVGQGPHYAGQLFGRGIYISGSGSNLTIVDNVIGLDAAGEPALGSVYGIDVGTWSYFGIDGITIEENVIAGHLFNGITVGSTVAQARLARNKIYGNASLGIDLVPSGFGYGVSPNDPLDADTGGNGMQNFPDIDEASTDGLAVAVAGALHSYPSETFTLEFFASTVCNDSGYGGGEVYLGETSVTTGASGDAGFAAQFAATVPVGWVVTATATREPLGATSEFSACVEIVEGVATAVDEPAIVRSGLGRPYPNPANPRISVALAVARPGHHRVRVIDAAGHAVATIFDEHAAAGTLMLRWDGRDAAGRTAPSGVYFLELTGESRSSRRFTLVR